jgi:hypothetical protein
MKNFVLVIVLLLNVCTGFTQRIGRADEKALELREDSLKKYAVKIIQGITATDRFTADSIFTKMLVRALKTPHSFYYRFDSLLTISRLYAPMLYASMAPYKCVPTMVR